VRNESRTEPRALPGFSPTGSSTTGAEFWMPTVASARSGAGETARPGPIRH
jgi:hypothetical protein